MHDIQFFVKNLRHNLTDPEKILWHYVRNRRFANYKFRRQVPIGKYIADFVCYEKRLIIELDGREHIEAKNLVHDKIRTQYLNERGFKVVRYYNTDVLNNIDTVLLDLWNKLQ